MKLPISESAQKAISILESHGYEAYCVGGAVRDLLMGCTPTDYDIATNALPEDVISLFPKTIATGIKHGTVTAQVDGAAIEITTYRADGDYADNRHPENVKFVAGIEEDLSRRDFTINAIAYSPERGILDPMGGVKDIKRKIIKCVGQPEKRFSEDALRIMRCFRFAATLGFGIESQTLKAAIDSAPLLHNISRERIFAELIKTLMGEHPEKAAPLLGENLGLLGNIPKDASARFATWCTLDGRDVAATAAALRSSTAFAQKANDIYQCIDFNATNMFSVRLQAARFGFENVRLGLIIGKEILGRDNDSALDMLAAAEKERFPLSPAGLALGGAELEKQGISGRQIGEILHQLFMIVLADPSKNTREELLKEIEKII